MKKLCSSAIAAAIGFMEICGFAEPASDTAATIGRIELIDYILIAGAALFLLGMLFILLSMYAGTRNKNNDLDADDIEEYKEFDEEQEIKETEADENTDIEDIEDIEEIEEIEETPNISEPDEAFEESDETEDGTELVEEETEETVESGQQATEEEDSEPEPEIEAEPEPEPEPEPELPKVRITLTGLNNFDVKITEFTDKATLGRRSGNDIIISDNAVSGSHCEFIFEDEKIYIADLNSTNGTMVNDEQIVKAEINSGDVLIIGKCKYRVNISM